MSLLFTDVADLVQKYESEQPRARHIFSPSPKVKGSNDSAHGGNEDTMEGETNQPVQSNVRPHLARQILIPLGLLCKQSAFFQ